MRRTLLVAVLFASSLVAGGHASSDESCGADCRAELARARAATAVYRDVNAAIGDGFVPIGDCASSVGIAYVNPSRWDSTVDVEEPELLLYSPEGLSHVNRRLLAARYAVPVVAVEGPGPRPELFGRPFDGPVPGALGSHYELTAWVWLDSPAGVFASTNPAAVCGLDDLRDPAGSLDGCFELGGTVGADPDTVRRVTGVPERYELLRGPDGSAQLFIASLSCTALTIAGKATKPVIFSEITPLVESPLGYTVDICCSRYLWTLATDNPDFEQFYRDGTGREDDRIVLEPIAYSHDPLLGTYSMRVDSLGYEVSGTTTRPAAPSGPASAHIFSDRPDSTFHVEFRIDSVGVGPATATLRADPGSPVAELLGTEPVSIFALTIGWERGAAATSLDPLVADHHTAT